MLHLSGSIVGPPLKPTIKVVVSEDFCCTSFQRGVQSFCFFLVFWLKNRFLNKAMVAIPFFPFFGCGVLGRCWYWISRKGMAKKTYKSFFFGHPLLERRKRVKIRERPEVQKYTTILHVFGGLKSGRKQQTCYFQKFAKTPIFKVLPGKVGAGHFLCKRLCYIKG